MKEGNIPVAHVTIRQKQEIAFTHQQSQSVNEGRIFPGGLRDCQATVRESLTSQ